MGSMKDLLGDDLFAPREPHQLTRRADPGTSFAAGAQVVPKLRELQKRVLDELRAAGPRGLCDFELEERCGSHGSTFRTQRSELVDLGLVRDSGQKREMAGSQRIVWVLAEGSEP